MNYSKHPTIVFEAPFESHLCLSTIYMGIYVYTVSKKGLNEKLKLAFEYTHHLRKCNYAALLFNIYLKIKARYMTRLTFLLMLCLIRFVGYRRVANDN